MRRLSIALGMLATGSSLMSCASIAGLDGYTDPNCAGDCSDAASGGQRPTVTDPEVPATTGDETSTGTGEGLAQDASMSSNGDADQEEVADDLSSGGSGGGDSGAGSGSGSGSGGGSGSTSGSGSGSGSSSGGATCAPSACTNICAPYFLQCCRSDQSCGCQLLFPQGPCE